MKVVKNKPCPWCGSSASIYIEPLWHGSRGYINCYNYEVQCNICHAVAPNGKFNDIYISSEEAEFKAYNTWNNRKKE